jgi:hypothetical protein
MRAVSDRDTAQIRTASGVSTDPPWGSIGNVSSRDDPKSTTNLPPEKLSDRLKLRIIQLVGRLTSMESLVSQCDPPEQGSRYEEPTLSTKTFKESTVDFFPL